MKKIDSKTKLEILKKVKRVADSLLEEKIERREMATAEDILKKTADGI
jgi:hypothetical protein